MGNDSSKDDLKYPRVTFEGESIPRSLIDQLMERHTFSSQPSLQAALSIVKDVCKVRGIPFAEDKVKSKLESDKDIEKSAFLKAIFPEDLNVPNWALVNEVEIDAPVTLVWNILTDFESYGRWNRYCIEAKGELKVGSEVAIVVVLDKSKERVNNRVLEVIPERKISWVSLNWYGAIVHGTRTRTLYSRTDGKTMFREVEVMEGPMAPIILSSMSDKLRMGIVKECESLKAEAESQAQSEEKAGSKR